MINKILSLSRKYFIETVLFFLIAYGFFFRINGLSKNYSFWSDEAHSAIFVKSILERGMPILQHGYSTGFSQSVFFYLSALLVKIFGVNEMSFRLISVIIGTLTILAGYLIGKKIFSKKVGLISSLLISLLNVEIIWSRQARPYQMIQLLYLIGCYVLIKISKRDTFDFKNFILFIIIGVLTTLTHGLGICLLFGGLLYLFICRLSFIKSTFKKNYWSFFLMMTFLLFFIALQHKPLIATLRSLGKVNNLFYYRIYFFKNYFFLFVLSVVGFIELARKKQKELLIIPILIFVQLTVISFVLDQAFIRYFYPLFAVILVISSYGITVLAKVLSKIAIRLPEFLVLIFVAFGVLLLLYSNNKLTITPRFIYSLNSDMGEIPEVDWKKLYLFVGEKIKRYPQAVLVANWNDLPVWYLGEGSLDYLVRTSLAEKDPLSGAYYLNNEEAFIDMIEKNESGLVIIDSWDSVVPDGVREYCQNNLKKELEIDRLYPVQPRYWLVTVYSWGLD